MPPAWDPQGYRQHSSMQLALGGGFLDRIAFRGDERVLDVGCGDGRMTERLRAAVPRGRVVGVDRSPAMVALARDTHPDLRFEVCDVRDLAEVAAYDAVTSFTALHWVVDAHDRALAAIARALVPGGRFLATFPGAGNCALLVACAWDVLLSAPYAAHAGGFQFPWLFAEPADYGRLLTGAGLEPERVELVAKDVTHDGRAALAGWLRTTWMPWTDALPPALREPWIADVVDAYAGGPMPPDAAGRLHVPSVRLEVEARRA